MTAWAQGGRMDAQSFAYDFFHRDADDRVVTSLRDAAMGAATATRQDELAAANPNIPLQFRGKGGGTQFFTKNPQSFRRSP
jgi:hypothetical protein